MHRTAKIMICATAILFAIGATDIAQARKKAVNVNLLGIHLGLGLGTKHGLGLGLGASVGGKKGIKTPHVGVTVGGKSHGGKSHKH